MTPSSTDRAVGLGAGMAGLLAARVLADRYAEVIVVDRDTLADVGTTRHGVAQGRHVHALLAGGQQALEKLLPGLTAELAALGAPVGDLLADTHLCFSGHRFRQGDAGLTIVHASRPFLEERVRARVRAHHDVTFIERCDVVGLTSTRGRGRVDGVRLLRRADGSAEEVLRADVVVDAMGRGSRAPRWLAALGCGRVPEERVGVDVGYATRTYRLPAGALGGAHACLQGPTPEHPRGGALARIEGGRWMLSLIGMAGDHPPTDPQGFTAFARSLRTTDIYDALGRGAALDDPVAFRFPAGVRRRYERLARPPAGFLVVGDSVCALNPVYGQGMTVAALEALALRDHLRQAPEPQPQQFLRAVARVVDPAWEMTAGADLAFPGVAGRPTRRARTIGAYIARLHAAAAHDATLGRAFLRVSALIDPPTALLRPVVAVQVLRRALRPVT